MKLIRLLVWRVLLYGGGSLAATVAAGRIGGCSPAGASVPARWEFGTVRRVVDGDTYEVLANYQRLRVRLVGVDAPELNQPGGRSAADSVTRLLRGRPVRLRRQGRDAYGRVVAELRVAVGPASRPARWVAADSQLVVRGWGWAEEPGQTPRRAAEQRQAQAAGRGLWRCGLAGPVRPAVWRSFNQQERARAWVGCPWR